MPLLAGGAAVRAPVWRRGGSREEAVRRAKIAQKTGVLKGILWRQGESDARDTRYLDKLKALIAALRKDLGEPGAGRCAAALTRPPRRGRVGLPARRRRRPEPET